MYAIRTLQLSEDDQIVSDVTGPCYYMFETANKLDLVLLRYRQKVIKR